MSLPNPLTHFPNFKFPTKLNPLYPSIVNPCSYQRLDLYRDLVSGYHPICRKSGWLMGERVVKISALKSSDGDESKISVLEQEGLVDGSNQARSNDFEATLNRLSKWLVTALFGAVVLYRHDAEAVWAGMGSIVNSALSVALKRILNQERPVANLRSDPGMPSSHATSIFYAVIFLVISMVEWLGVNELTLTFATASLAFGSYLSWLRVTQRLHTISQVAVGAVLGSCFCLLWLWSWNAVVSDAFSSFLWVQVSVLLGSAVLGLGFFSYVVRYWFTNDG